MNRLSPENKSSRKHLQQLMRVFRLNKRINIRTNANVSHSLCSIGSGCGILMVRLQRNLFCRASNFFPASTCDIPGHYDTEQGEHWLRDSEHPGIEPGSKCSRRIATENTQNSHRYRPQQQHVDHIEKTR